jgi:tRNA (guanine37-N1)-methyltransferase
MWQANVFTLFPDAFPGALGVSLVGRALESHQWKLNLIDMKQFPVKSDRVDDIPTGGGVGMILSPITFQKAFNILDNDQKSMRRIFLSPRGRQLNQLNISEIANSSGITILCGRYEGVDQRILDYYLFQEVSIGDFVLLGGEAAAMVIIEACVRLLPQIVGNIESINDDSFGHNLLEYDQYTKPRDFNGLSVPEILLSGNHQKIKEFRTIQSKRITMKRRSDLWKKYVSEELKNIR